MERAYRNRILVQSVIICIVLMIIAYFGRGYYSPELMWFIFLVPLVALTVNILGFFVTVNKSAQRNPNTLISSLFGIKFFSYLFLAFAFFLLESQKSVRLFFVAFIFLSYLLNTIILLTGILGYYKAIKDK